MSQIYEGSQCSSDSLKYAHRENHTSNNENTIATQIEKEIVQYLKTLSIEMKTDPRRKKTTYFERQNGSIKFIQQIDIQPDDLNDEGLVESLICQGHTFSSQEQLKQMNFQSNRLMARLPKLNLL